MVPFIPTLFGCIILINCHEIDLFVQENPVLRAGSEVAGSTGTINKA
jgi:hypothetical protein